MLARRRRRSLALRSAAGVALAALLGACGSPNPATDGAQVQRGVKAIEGIQQDGFTLGDPQAPWTLSIISSPTSYELDGLISELPELARRFVRPGQLKLQMRTPTKGPYGVNGEEREVAGALIAAGLQNHYWDMLVRFVPRYDGAVTLADLVALLRRAGVPDVARAMTQRSTTQVRAALDRADEVATAIEGEGQLVYAIARAGEAPQRLTYEQELRTLADEVEGVLR